LAVYSKEKVTKFGTDVCGIVLRELEHKANVYFGKDLQIMLNNDFLNKKQKNK